jgi:ubiquinone biosynthesis protein UbiJ
MREIESSISDELTRLLQKCLSADMDSKNTVTSLNGSCLHIVIDPPGIMLEIKFSNDAVVLDFRESCSPDVIITGELVDFFSLIRSHIKKLPIASGTVNVVGDLGMAQKMQSLFSTLSIDLESALSLCLGPVLAHQLYLTISIGSSKVTKSFAELEDDIVDYLRDESTLLAKRIEFQSLSNDVLSFCDQVENFEFRLGIELKRAERFR